MESTQLRRKQTKSEPVSGRTRKAPARVIGAQRRPLFLDDTHSPVSRLGRAFGTSHTGLPHALQAKLTVNAPGDRYEQEADRVAEQVMRMPGPPAPRLQRKCGCGGSTGSGESCEGCASHAPQLQRRAMPQAESEITVPGIVNQVLGSPGQALGESTRAFFESRFGQDFSRVRIHSDERAVESARAVNALAYTVGHNVIFGVGQYQPVTSEGRRLLAHELAHVVQQNGSVPRNGPRVTPGEDSSTERRAETGAGAIHNDQGPVVSAQRTNTLVQRQPRPTAPTPAGPGSASCTPRTGFGEYGKVVSNGAQRASSSSSTRRSWPLNLSDTRSPAVRLNYADGPSRTPWLQSKRTIKEQDQPLPIAQNQPTMLARQANGAGAPCVPGPGKTNSDCSAYLRNAWWLPFAYANNATCACGSTPNVPTANCVRRVLQDRLAATPTALKVLAASQKYLDNVITYPLYQNFVQMVLTPRIYWDHVVAYRSCCCPSGPAPYPSWIGVTSVPIRPCSLVGLSIRHFGSCTGTPGAW